MKVVRHIACHAVLQVSVEVRALCYLRSFEDAALFLRGNVELSPGLRNQDQDARSWEISLTSDKIQIMENLWCNNKVQPGGATL